MKFDNASEIACDIIDKAIAIFSNIGGAPLSYRIKTFFGSENVSLSVVDKCCLCLLIATVNVSSNLKRFMSDFSIDDNSVMSIFELNDDILLANLKDEEKKLIYDKKFNLIVEGIANNYAFLSEENLIRGLLSQKICGSGLPYIVINDILNNNSFISIESFENYLNKLASEKDDEYIEKNPIIKSKTKNSVSNNSNAFASMFGFGSSITSTNEIGIYLTNKQYEFNPVIGRDDEMKSLIVSLLTIEQSSLLLGKPGVGKSILVEGLAYLIQNDLVPEELKNKKILMINASELVRGCGIVGSLEEKLSSVLEKVEKDGNTILFVDELHTAIGAGASMNSNLDVANILKPYLSSGRIKMIGATTKDEFLKYIVQDGAFDRRFGIVEIAEPNEKQLVEIVDGVISNYEKVTGIRFQFKNQDKDKILNSIMEVTDSKSRKDSSKAANPALALEILKRTFAYSKYHNRDEVAVSDVVEAIMDNDRIYESVRQRHCSKLQSYFNSSKEKNKSLNKVIQFNDYSSKKSTF